jgi:tRNA(fMet)-specific endonuclease VapC
LKKYLLDTNICAYFFNGQFNLKEKIRDIGFENCVVSEITIAELKYGIAKSSKKKRTSMY